MTPIDEHLAGLPEPQRATLQRLADDLRALLPAAEEKISYRMPCFALQGKAVAGFEGFTEHCSYFPHSGTVVPKVTGLPTWAQPDRGTVRFPIGKRLPKQVLRQLIRFRLDEVSEVANGKRFEFFDDGSVKAAGSMRDGLLHGNWTWYRRDGSVLRTGSFRRGEQVGEWRTWTRDQQPPG